MVTMPRWGVPAIAAAAFALALALRLSFLAEHPPELYLVGDMALYAEQGQALFSRARVPWDTFTPPGYPAFLAVLGTVERVGAAQAVLGATTAALTTLLAHRLSRDALAAALAGVVTACYFPLVFYTGFVLTETLFAALLTALLWLALVACERGSRALGSVAGLTLALAATVRPSLLLFLPFLAWMALGRGRFLKREVGVLRAALFAASVALALVAWHTSLVLGRPATIASNGGVNFYLAHSECRSVRSLAGGRVVEVSTHYTRTHHREPCVIERPLLDEPWLYKTTLAAIAREPKKLVTALDGVREGLGIAPARGRREPPYWPGSFEHGEELDRYSRTYPWVVLLPALAGAALARRRADTRLAHRLAWSLLGSVCIALYAYNGNPRVRLSSDPVAIALACGALASLGRAAHASLGRRRATRS